MEPMDNATNFYMKKILEQHREVNKNERQMKRETVINKRRGILGSISCATETSFTIQQVITLASKLKLKNQTDEKDLNILSRSFIQDEHNIDAFLKVDGAIQGLVRELSGSCSQTQLAATECVINLALGDKRSCFKVAKFSGLYLINHLQGMNINLQNASLWALGNLVGSDEKTWDLLRTQGLLQYLLKFVDYPTTEMEENVVYALIHYVTTGFNYIERFDFLLIARSIIKLRSYKPDVLWLLYLLSCSGHCDSMLAEKMCSFLDTLSKPIEHHVRSVTASVRILANLISEESGCYAELIIHNFDGFYKRLENLIRILREGLGNFPHLLNEIRWLVGNLIHHPSGNVKFKCQLIGEELNNLVMLLM